jgi:hypothetical protein
MALPSHLCFTLYSFHKQTEIYKLAAISHHARSLFLSFCSSCSVVCACLVASHARVLFLGVAWARRNPTAKAPFEHHGHGDGDVIVAVLPYHLHALYV